MKGTDGGGAGRNIESWSISAPRPSIGAHETRLHHAVHKPPTNPVHTAPTRIPPMRASGGRVKRDDIAGGGAGGGDPEPSRWPRSCGAASAKG